MQKLTATRVLPALPLEINYRAMEDFNQALRLDPELAAAYYNRGFVRSKLQNYQGAIENFT